MKVLKLLLFLFVLNVSAQQGGMWIPSLLEGMNETEMKALGSKLSAKDIYDINNSSLKDAIGHFNGGCTAEVISKKGLILTNHHCGYGQIQSHSTLENDYLKNGFWAKDRKSELPNENLYVDFIVRIEDVTANVLAGVSTEMTEREKQSKINKNIKVVKQNTTKEDWQNTKVKSFYKGNQYFIFVYERYTDIRLVGAPPSSVGKYGNDTDNWVFPRHTGDFSLFRIYAGKKNRPADYSPNNKPYKPKHFLPISLDGIAENDFTMVFGFPGRTNEYLPAVAIKYITKQLNPTNIAIREAAIKEMDAKMKVDDVVRIKYASKQARIANYWKKWIGENLGIEKSNAIEQRIAFEKTFVKALKEENLTEKYGYILPEFEKLYAGFSDVAVKRQNFIEVFYTTNELMQLSFRAYQLEMSIKRNPKGFEEARERFVSSLKAVHKNYDVTVDKNIFKAVMPLYTKQKADASIYETSALTSVESGLKLVEGTADEVAKKLEKDSAVAFATPFINEFYTSLNPDYSKKNTAINALQKTYMKALMEALPNARYFPDANGTLRITYGKVKGYSPRDAVYYKPVTYLDGVIEKYKPNDYEYDLPTKLIDLYNKKDYGQYKDETGKVPVCFIATNHTTGGNSGSPAIDAEGNLIGLNFDRVWEGTMSDINYDPEICRNIMVDARYVLFIIDKFAGAKHLIKELKLVHPKK